MIFNVQKKRETSAIENVLFKGRDDLREWNKTREHSSISTHRLITFIFLLSYTSFDDTQTSNSMFLTPRANT